MELLQILHKKKEINQMKKNVFFVFMAVLALCSCSNTTKKTLGLSKTAPNEYMVEPRAPLSLPPEYNLRPVNQENYNQNQEAIEGISSGEKDVVEAID